MTLRSTLLRPVIMCGGSGTRLWPASREAFPKQFAPLIGKRSTFQETVLRFAGRASFGKPLIVTNVIHRFLVERQLSEIGVAADILLEPVARDSGPAVLASALTIAADDPGALVLMLAADHVVLDPAAFRRAVEAGCAAALSGAIVTFGITPTHPATGYGYIAPGDVIEGSVRKVSRFVEKPDAATAAEYIAAGYVWNSGNFLFRPDRVIAEYEAGDPVSVAAIRAAIAEADRDLGVPVLNEPHFLEAKKISFDFAVMERTRDVAVVSGDFGWSDIGGWDALWDISAKDDAGNVGLGDAHFFASTGSYASAENQLVTLVGVTDTIVVATRDAILVADKARAGDVKGVVEKLRAEKRREAVNHARTYRPWGWYQTLETLDRSYVKRITVYPGGRLSLHRHERRAEHLVVVKGTVKVTLGEVATYLEANQSTYIPQGAIHRFENPGTEDIEIIEVATGDYLGEDDIIRIADDYGRV